MKMTVIVKEDGTLVGTARHIVDASNAVKAVVRPRAGHVLHEIEVPDHYCELKPSELHERIRTIHMTEHYRKQSTSSPQV